MQTIYKNGTKVITNVDKSGTKQQFMYESFKADEINVIPRNYVL